MRRAIEVIVSAVLGAIVASVGAIAHRSYPPFGVILSALLVLASVVFVRAWGRWASVIAFAVPFAALTTLFARPGPGGSLLIAGDHLGEGYLLAAGAAVVVACLLPARLLGAAPARAGRVPGA